MTANIAFLCSGGGGNLRLIHALVNRGSLRSMFIGAVIADRDCHALDWARDEGIATRRIVYTRAQPDPLHDVLEQLAPDLIVTTVHKILDDCLVEQYEGRLVNLHYSLLPAFPGRIGMEPVRLARIHGCRLIGATAHRVTTDLDCGPILAQACVIDEPAQPDLWLYDAVFRCGGVALTVAVDGILNSRMAAVGGLLQAGTLTLIATPMPRPEVCDALASAALWQGLR